MNDPTSLQTRRQRLQNRLIEFNLPSQITYLPYLSYLEVSFQSPERAAQRMIILYTLSYLAHDLEQREGAIGWLLDEGLWDEVSPRERGFLTSDEPSQEEIIQYSWRAEAVHTLAWSLNFINELKAPVGICDTEQLEQVLPPLATPLDGFPEQQTYRPLSEIYDENLFNELATGHFRDVSLGVSKYEGPIDPVVSYERHLVLNWLRKFENEEAWDETHTDT